ncbi:MAG: hypothetical protein Q8M50_11220 [Hydrogenophaga sp.]|uniref:hypothetical protein n=1 Tax=Hydrogenophaga sp. TaxID=1904254 RepID=UPI002730B5AF|nr:hypothetical protein [Hydrogenophaga sp.]MDP2406812.1 hypothetical protein [Hydrogenophaga sp.]
MDTQRRRFLASLAATAVTTQLFGCGVLSGGAMKPSNSIEKLREFLATRGISESKIMAPKRVSNGIEFYKSVPCSDLADTPQADALLVQWSFFAWGKGEHFEFDIARQFIRSEAFGDDTISQLCITAYYSPMRALRTIRAENCWCQSVADIASFEDSIPGSSAFNAVSLLRPSRLAIEWEQV